MPISVPAISRSDYLINVNSPTGIQSDATIQRLSNGQMFAVWNDQAGVGGGDIRGTFLDARGFIASSTITINSDTSGLQGDPTVTQLTDGRIVVAWTDNTTSNLEFTTLTQGVGGAWTVGAETVVASFNAALWQREAVVTPLGSGFALTYTDQGASQGNDIRQIIYNSSLAPGGDNKVNDEVGLLSNGQYQSASAKLVNGNVIVVWTDVGVGVNPYTLPPIRARIYDGVTGVPGAIFFVNDYFISATNTNVGTELPTVTAMSNGGFAVFWSAYTAAGDQGDIRGRIFNSSGGAIGSDFSVESVAGKQTRPTATALPDGNIVVAWVDETPSSVVPDIVRAKLISSNGLDMSSTFTVTANANNSSSSQGTNIEMVSIDSLNDGRFIVSWTDVSGALGDSDQGIHAAIYDTRTSRSVWIGTSGGDQYVGSDIVVAADGSGFPTGDDLRGGAGNDTIWGGAGDDYIQAGTGTNEVHGDAGNDMLSFYDLATTVNFTLPESGAGDFTAPGGIARFIYDGIEWISGSDYGFTQGFPTTIPGDTLTGDSQDNAIIGFWGNDIVNGGGGNDTLIGGEGNDTLIGGAGNDKLNGNEGDDFIYYDPADTAANVTGGTGTDTLYVANTVLALPTSFNLTTQGFERAQVDQIDTGALTWATRTIFYAPGWVSTSEVGTYDSGDTYNYTWTGGVLANFTYNDVANPADAFTSYTITYNTGGQEISVVGVYDDARTFNTIKDFANANPWSSITTVFASAANGGAVLYSNTDYDNGDASVATYINGKLDASTTYDLGVNDQPYQYYTVNFNALGVAFAVSGIYDNGTPFAYLV
jgi:Ca2+-binding RTX toxin-like protein